MKEILGFFKEKMFNLRVTVHFHRSGYFVPNTAVKILFSKLVNCFIFNVPKSM